MTRVSSPEGSGETETHNELAHFAGAAVQAGNVYGGVKFCQNNMPSGEKFADERLKASLDVIKELEPWLEQVRRWAATFSLNSYAEAKSERQKLHDFDWESHLDKLGEAWRPLTLLASYDTREAFAAMMAQLIKNYDKLIEVVEQGEWKGLDKTVTEMNNHYWALVDALREDLRAEFR